MQLENREKITHNFIFLRQLMWALTVRLLALFSLLHTHLEFSFIYGWYYQAQAVDWILHCGNISFLAALNLQSSISSEEGNQKGQCFAQMQSSNEFVIGVTLLFLLVLVHLITLSVFLVTQEYKCGGERQGETWKGQERL